MRITKQTPLDTLLRDLEREFNAGRIGVDKHGSIKQLTDVYSVSDDYDPTSQHPYCSTRQIKHIANTATQPFVDPNNTATLKTAARSATR